MCTEPTLLDWLSGLVVPLMLGGLTAGVAIWAVLVAKRSNKLASEAQANSKRDRRAAYASPLWHRALAMLAARQVGRDPLQDIYDGNLEAAQVLDSLRLGSGESTATILSEWVMKTARLANAAGFDEFLALHTRISDTIELWVTDPQSAMKAIDADSWFAEKRETRG